MAFLYFLGRVLFVSIFLFSAWQEFKEFGVDGGSAAKTLTPKFNMLSEQFTTLTGFEVPIFEIKTLVAGSIALRAIGSFLFIFDSTIGATLLILHQSVATPVLYDFYNYEIGKQKFLQLFVRFTQSLALLGGLLFYVGMKNSIPKRFSIPNHRIYTTQTDENTGDEYVDHMKDELKQARAESAIMFEKLKHTQARLNETQEELSQCHQEITRLNRELKGNRHAEGFRPQTSKPKRNGWFR